MQRWLEQYWYSDNASFWRLFAVFPSFLLATLVRFRRFLYQTGLVSSWRSPVPVIVVGNVTVGGTGKTPLVIWLAEQLQAKGYSPGIISRGYGGAATQITEVTKDTSAALVGDEPLLMAMRTSCPVWIGKKRPAVIRSLLKAHPQCDVIISDDGLQHYALKRDFEIVMVDGVRRYGNGAMLPFGPMREPASRVIEADALVVNGGDSDMSEGEYLMRLNGEIFHTLNDMTHTAIAKDFEAKQIHAVAGIGNPARFFNQLRQLGLTFVEHAFPDHHPFSLADLQINGAEVILMTEKDAVKCSKFALKNIWVLPVQAHIELGLENKVVERINSFYGR
ncbi:tetraacyldisaccharide 4'-kinase [Candidatus Methylopumilus turicensis]|uniref:Tetraacyldisaccharide 4'-kinase n=1 Tax=Candidatus Methylopumilus turicensis TaxID=1581680 RepID=A0A0B7IWT7_9PROT|nr:tetraacyldisaccharide 4'-kinase [Candidatus Methylopumilus turicensis]CEN55537.1 lipid A 4'kinase [Candidatus Methylopumilus turicensis]